MPSAQGGGRTHSGDASKTFKAKLGTANIVSYEDLLIAQYIDDIKKGPDVGNSKSESSPYLGKYHTLEEGLYRNGMRPRSGKKDRPVSAQHRNRNRPVSGDQSRPYSAMPSQQKYKPKIDAKFIADPDLWDPATPREEKRSLRRTRSAHTRPQSATVAHYRTGSAKKSYSSLIDNEIYEARRPRKKQALYKRQPYVIRCVAYKNGDRDIYAQVAAPSVKQLLECCTTKLQLNGAARRIFLDDGTEIFETNEIPKDGDIYVSNGEAFKNPFKALIQRHEEKQQLQWTMKGLSLPQGKKKKSKFILSKRFKEMVTVTNRRVMIYLNGQHTNCQEVISDLKSIEDFLGDATNKLALRSHARIIYDWNGEEVESLESIPVLDACLQDTGTPVLGPVWISCGGGFSPVGASKFLEDIISHLRKNIKDSRYNKTQMEYAREAITDESAAEKVELVTMMSMSEAELDKSISGLTTEISKMTATLKKMKSIHSTVSEQAAEEEKEGYKYTLQNIKELDINDRAVGGIGLKLKVYRNGDYGTPAVVYFNTRQASRGIKDSQLIFERLLDQCSSRVAGPSSQGTKFARRLFDANGEDITELSALHTDQEIFLSMGEPFKVPYVLCLQAHFEQVRGIEMQYPPESQQRQVAKFHQAAVFLEMEPGKANWEGSIGFPADYHWASCNSETDPMIRDEIMQSKDIDLNTHLLVHKEKRDIVLYPTLVVSDRKKKGSKELWPNEAQQWVLTKGGYISARGMPNLVMSVLDTRVDCKAKSRQKTHLQGYAVGLQKRQEGNPAQQWRFTKEGTIHSVSQSGLILTFLGAKHSQSDEDMVQNEVEGLPDGFIPHLAVCEKISGKDSSLQRFAMKQERFDNLGQWKLNDQEVVTNPEFNKLAYSWPVNSKDELNDRFDWPMEFFFIAKAPPLLKAKKDSSGHTPLRLVVMKNGESDTRHCCPVVGPDLTNMIRDLSKQGDKKGHGHRHGHSHGGHSHSHGHSGHNNSPKKGKAEPDKDDSVSDFPLHCDDLTFRELEFRLFLERCTGMLNLPFAARRLFDEEGREHHTLKELTRDQLVYATCGETWIDPRITKAESQRRFLLSNLSSDIAQIRQFCALRDTEGYVLEVEGAAVANARVILNHCPDMQDKIQTEAAEQDKREKEEAQAQIDADLLQANATWHERSHQKCDDKEDKLKWPWERLANDELLDIQESPRRSPSPLRSKSGTRAVRNVQRFVYDEGYIVCHCDLDLVLGVISTADGQGSEVALVKRKKDELSQMWIVKPNGNIHIRSEKNMVLTVVMPTNQRRDEEGLTLNYVGCQVTVQKRRTTQFGSASQKWNFEPETGSIYAFHTNHLDVEVTAANKSNVCTYAVTKDELDQPGYIVSLPTKNNKHNEVVVCTSCARSMRGRFKLTKLPESYDFSCVMGTTKLKELKNIGSFHCLNGKVDLSTFEAINTLDEWETKYNALYEENSVRSIAKEISASETPKTVKIYAYKNGNGREKEGQLIVGSSIIGLLDQSTYRLGMTSAARRLYTRDGTVILDTDDLISWAVEHYVANMQSKGGRRPPDNSRMDPEGTQESENTDDTAPQYSILTVETEADGESYQPVNEEPLDIAESALFEVSTGCNDHIALIYNTGTESDVVYEVIIGRTTESAIIIHPSPAVSATNRKTQGDDYDPYADMVVSKYPAVEPSGLESEQYWMSWSNSTVKVGRGDVIGDKQFMSSVDPESRKVNYIVVASQGADTNWTFKIPDYAGSVPNSNGTGPTDVNKLMDKVELNEDDEETGSKKDDLSEAFHADGGKERDTVEVSEPMRRVSRPRTAAPSKQEPPPIDTILKYPIEVWASAGDKFVKPEKVAADQKEMKNYRSMVSDITFELQKEKHKLRQLQGRRLTGQQPGHYVATGSSVNPVVKRNHWQEPGYGETVAHDEVHQLQNQQMALQAKQRNQMVRRGPSARLYTQPTMKRVLAYVNGEPISRAQYIWGSDLEQILQNATSRLNIRRAAKCIYSLSGQQLKYEDMEKDQIVCVSTGAQFQRPKDMQQEVEIRANWTRARKQMGPEATDITVYAHLNPDIDVDPFGPPSLATGSAKSHKF